MQIKSITEALNDHLIQGETGSPTAIKPTNTPNAVSEEFDRTPGGTPLEYFIGKQPQNTYPPATESPDDYSPNQSTTNANNAQPHQVQPMMGPAHTPTSDDEYILPETDNSEKIIDDLNVALDELRKILQLIENDRKNNLVDPERAMIHGRIQQKIARLLTDPSLNGQEVIMFLTQEAIEQIAQSNWDILQKGPNLGTGINPTPFMLNGKVRFLITAKFADNRSIAISQNKLGGTYIQVEYSGSLKYLHLSICDHYGQRVYPKDVALYPHEIQSFTPSKTHNTKL